MSEKPEVVQLQPYGEVPKPTVAGKAERAWFEDEVGYHAEIELDGQKFQIREVSDQSIKDYGRKEREAAKAFKAIADEQKKYEDAEQEIPADKVDEFTQRSTELTSQQIAFSTELVVESLVGWSLPRELNADNIAKLSKTARRQLAQLIAQRSTLGADERDFLPKRSRK